tara:strand:- start:33368 stop:34510 length:1143 start_codon:yes stop_codon:yes gene_type:complete
MAVPTYDQTLDTLVSTAIETYSRDPINALTDSGEKFLKAAASQGRVFVVNDAETVRHPILYGHGEDSSLYVPDTLTGTPDVNNLSATAKEILTQSMFFLQAATRNINFPQSQPPGNLIDYVSSVVKANMMKIFNEEEILFVRGAAAGGATEAIRAPMTTDADYTAGFPMSLASIFLSSSNPSSGNAGEDTTAESFANVKVDDVPKWQPTHVTGDSTTHATMFADIQNAIFEASYSEVERPTHVYMPLASFEKFLSLLRAFAALPDPVRTNMGKEGTIEFGGVTMDWSRYLAPDAIYDVTDPGNTTATYPILGVNWNSLRLNTVRAGSPGSDNLGFIRQIGAVQPHPMLTNVFKRIEWKRQWSVDNGRRSFFIINNYTSIA